MIMIMVMVVVVVMVTLLIARLILVLGNTSLAQWNQGRCAMPIAHAVLLAAVAVMVFVFALVRQSDDLATHAPAPVRDVVSVDIGESKAQVGVTHGHEASQSQDLLRTHFKVEVG